eukprot:gene8523-biopygen13677
MTRAGAPARAGPEQCGPKRGHLCRGGGAGRTWTARQNVKERKQARTVPQVDPLTGKEQHHTIAGAMMWCGNVCRWISFPKSLYNLPILSFWSGTSFGQEPVAGVVPRPVRPGTILMGHPGERGTLGNE